MLNPKAFGQVFMMLKLYRCIERCLAFVGLGRFIERSVFDGVYYHILHDEWLDMDAEIKRQKLEEVKHLRDIYCSTTE